MTTIKILCELIQKRNICAIKIMFYVFWTNLNLSQIHKNWNCFKIAFIRFTLSFIFGPYLHFKLLLAQLHLLASTLDALKFLLIRLCNFNANFKHDFQRLDYTKRGEREKRKCPVEKLTFFAHTLLCPGLHFKVLGGFSRAMSKHIKMLKLGMTSKSIFISRI